MPSTNPMIGEIMLTSISFTPAGWERCDGQILAIQEYDDLFSVLGNKFGGDGETTFALPNLNGRIPICAGPGYTLGATGGVESVTLSEQQIPAHIHRISGTLAGTSTAATKITAAGNSIGQIFGLTPSGREMSTQAFNETPSQDVFMAANSLSLQLEPVGGNHPHNNMQPYIVLSYMIAIEGRFPQRG